MNKVIRNAIVVIALLASFTFIVIGVSAQNSNMSAGQMKSTSTMNNNGMMRQRRMRRRHRRMRRHNTMMKKEMMKKSDMRLAISLPPVALL